MMVPWPWIKASHPVRGHGCFRLGPRGGVPLRARVYKFDRMLREVVASPSQGFSYVVEGDSWLRNVEWVCTG